MFGYLGEIRLFAGAFVPAGWAFCNGQILNINTNVELHTIIGYTYGGNGQTTFALPDLRSRIIVGSNPSANNLGDPSGDESVQLIPTNFPNHTHTVACNNTSQNSNTPVGNFPAVGQSLGSPPRQTPIDRMYTATATDESMMANTVIMQAGGATLPSMSVIQPSFGMNYIICVIGDYPPRPSSNDSSAQDS